MIGSHFGMTEVLDLFTDDRLHFCPRGVSDGRTDAANIIRGVCPSVGLSRVVATSTRRDGGDRWTLLPCVFVRPSVRSFQTPSKKRTDGRIL